MLQFYWQLEATNSCFWLVNILLRKFYTSSKKEMKMIKLKFCDEKLQQQHKAKIVYESIK